MDQRLGARQVANVRVAASVLPKEARVEVANDLERISDEQLGAKIDHLVRERGYVK